MTTQLCRHVALHLSVDWRVTGCRYATVGAVVDPVTNEKQEKAVFVVFFAGERARVKILKASLSCGSICLMPVAMLACALHSKHVRQASASTDHAAVRM